MFLRNSLFQHLQEEVSYYSKNIDLSKNGESKESQSWVHLAIPAAEALSKIFAKEIEKAKNTGVQLIFTYIVINVII